jgi:hypothetical protein
LPPSENGWPATAVDIGRSKIAEALVVTAGVVELDELGQTGFELTRQVVASIHEFFELNARSALPPRLASVISALRGSQVS